MATRLDLPETRHITVKYYLLFFQVIDLYGFFCRIIRPINTLGYYANQRTDC